MMDVAERNDRTLRRIMATLMALAVIAERVAGRSFPVRWLVLLILHRAEAVARAHVEEATGMDWSLFDQPSGIGGGPVDAACLAQRFRMLAAALCLLLPPTCRFGRRSAGLDGAPRRPAPRGRLLPMPAGPGGWLFDTS